MQTVGLVVTEIACVRIVERIEPAQTVEVYHRHGPYAGGFLHRLDILVEEHADAVCETLVGLYVVRAETCVGTVDWREHDNLLIGIIGLEKVHQYVYAALERGVAHHRRTVFAHGLSASADNGLALARLVPFVYGHTAVVVVGTCEYHYCVHAVATFLEQTARLTGKVAHLVTVDAIHQRHDAEHVGQIFPVAAGGAYALGVGDGVAEECHTAAAPLVIGHGLTVCAHIMGGKHRQRHELGKQYDDRHDVCRGCSL